MALGRLITLDALGTLVELHPPAPRLVAELGARGVAASERQAAAALAAEIAFYRAHHDSAGDASSLGALRDQCTVVLRHVRDGAIRPHAPNALSRASFADCCVAPRRSPSQDGEGSLLLAFDEP